jgi:hypothetical protein
MNRRGAWVSPLGCLSALLLSLATLLTVWLSGGAIFSPGALTAEAASHAPIQGFTSHADFEADCNLCHVPVRGTTAERCEACHADVAAERAAGTGLHGKLEAETVTRCGTCHPDHKGRDFNPNTNALKAFDHTAASFNLAHHLIGYDGAPLACQECHTSPTYSFEGLACVQCHAANDAPFMTDHLRAFGVQCLDCHDGVDRMTGFDHAATHFALTGSHQVVACSSCHSPGVPADQTPTDCAACHAEPAAHAGDFGTDCAACHTADAWSPARVGNKVAFQHASTGFQLGLHLENYDGSTLTCSSCHTGSTFEFAAQTCLDCHQGHEAAFMDRHVANYGPNCTSCHDGTGNMRGFDHSQVFPLDGQHAALQCDACHADQQFNTAPSECSACHAEPEIHVGVFGQACGDCHTTAAWAPAQLTRHTFPLNHGGQGEIDCETCHASSYVTYSCYGCHDHVEANMQQEHQKVGITGEQLKDCVACHADGHTTSGGGKNHERQAWPSSPAHLQAVRPARAHPSSTERLGRLGSRA